MIRPDSTIAVSAPTFTGYGGAGGFTQSLRVIAFSGKTELGDYSDAFIITTAEDGSATLQATAAVDHGLKYKLRRELYIPAGDEQSVPVSLKDAPLTVKMGSA